MYANFYYQRSTKKYGRGPWLDMDGEAHDRLGGDMLYNNQDFLHIGRVYDEQLFKDAELSV